MGFLGKIFGGGSSLDTLQIRVVKKELESVSGLIVECKGLMPVYSRTEIGFVTSILCKDKDRKFAPVLSMIDQCQEELTSAYQHTYEIGEVDGPGGYSDWVGIAVIIPDLIHPAYGGEQTLGVVVRLVDMNNMPSIILGYCPRSDCIWTDSVDFKYNFKDEDGKDIKGFKEEEADRDEARALSVKLGMAVAMADGELDDSEGKTLNKWIKKIISPYSEDKQESLKNIYNSALKESYKLAESGNLKLTDICKQMNKVAEAPQIHEALELAHEVMAADGILDQSETKMINKIAALLEIDTDELETIRDKQLVGFKPKFVDDDDDDDDDDPEDDPNGGNPIDVEGLLGIDPTWSNKKIRAHLGKEFTKRNGRMNSLSEGAERQSAQKMLDLIAKTRKKYEE